MLRIRSAVTDDAEAIAAIYNQGIAERSATFETAPRTAADMAAAVGDARHPFLVAERDGAVVGWAAVAPYSTRACYAGVGEATIYVAREARGSGVGRRLAEGLAAEAERRGFHKLLGRLFTTNAASARLVLGCGFREVGVHVRHAKLDGEWRDVLLVERLLGEAARPRRRSPGENPAHVARVFVITGPSGVGKGTLIRLLRARIPQLALSVSATTRAPRPGERDGVDYRFLDDAEFQRRVDAGEFVEHATYAGRRYGTLRAELEKHLRAGRPVVLEIEVQGARQVRETMPEAVQVFIAPPSRAALRDRLVGRGTDDPREIEERLRTADAELAARDEFPHVVVNDRLEPAVDRLAAIVEQSLADRAASA